MTDEHKIISAERALELTENSKRVALDLETPIVIGKIMEMIKDATKNGKHVIYFMMSDVIGSDAPPGLIPSDLRIDVIERLRAHGYVVINNPTPEEYDAVTVQWGERQY